MGGDNFMVISSNEAKKAAQDFVKLVKNDDGAKVVWLPKYKTPVIV